MNTTSIKQSPGFHFHQQANHRLEIELQELEDSYAESLGDNADAQTLTMLWLRIKAIKRQLSKNR